MSKSDVVSRAAAKRNSRTSNKGAHDGLDDLVADKELDEEGADETAANSGDELGHSKEVKNEDLVTRAMRKRSK